MLSSVRFVILVPYGTEGRTMLFQKVFPINNLLQLFSITLYVMFAILQTFCIILSLCFEVVSFIIYIRFQDISLSAQL